MFIENNTTSSPTNNTSDKKEVKNSSSKSATSTSEKPKTDTFTSTTPPTKEKTPAEILLEKLKKQEKITPPANEGVKEFLDTIESNTTNNQYSNNNSSQKSSMGFAQSMIKHFGLSSVVSTPQFGVKYNHPELGEGYLQLDGSFYFPNPAKYDSPMILCGFEDYSGLKSGKPSVGTLALSQLNLRFNNNDKLVDSYGSVHHIQLDGSVFDTGKTEDGREIRNPSTISATEETTSEGIITVKTKKTSGSANPLTILFDKLSVQPLMTNGGFKSSLSKYSNRPIFLQPTTEGSLTVFIPGESEIRTNETYVFNEITQTWNLDTSSVGESEKPYLRALTNMLNSGDIKIDPQNPKRFTYKDTNAQVFFLSSGRIWFEGNANEPPRILSGNKGALTEKEDSEINEQREKRFPYELRNLATLIDTDKEPDLSSINTDPIRSMTIGIILNDISKLRKIADSTDISKLSDLEKARFEDQKRLVEIMEEIVFYTEKIKEDFQGDLDNTEKFIMGKRFDPMIRVCKKLVYELNSPNPRLSNPFLHDTYSQMGRGSTIGPTLINVSPKFLAFVKPHIEFLTSELARSKAELISGRTDCKPLIEECNYNTLNFIKQYYHLNSHSISSAK